MIKNNPTNNFFQVLFNNAVIALFAQSCFLQFLSDEQLEERFVKMNPQHTVPTINDNGFILWER